MVKQKKRKRSIEDPEDGSTPIVVRATGRKLPKKKKSSPQNKEREAEIPIDPALTSNSEGPADPQTVAFLQALVAAADPTNPQLISTQVAADQQLIHPAFDPNSPMIFSNHFVPMTPGFPYPMQSGFVDPAGLVSGTQGRLSLPELASHANDEIMRTLQGVDLAKLQGVLQVLGDAAAAAEQPSDVLHVSPGFQGMPPPPTLPPTKQNPAPSHTILGQPSKNNEPPPPPDWQQFANPVHAELLATKWMNTAKLKEMAQTEGPSCL